MIGRRMARTAAAGVLAVALALTSTGCSMLNAENIPVSTGAAESYEVTVMFPDALNLANGAAIKIDGATVGRVQDISTEDFEAKVVLAIDSRQSLPEDTVFRLRPTTALGELFVEIVRGDSPGDLEAGTTVPVTQTRTAPTVEDGLAAASLLINGGSLGQIKTIVDEVNTTMDGRTDVIRDFINGTEVLVGSLNDSTGDLDEFMTSLAHTSRLLNEREAEINRALELTGPVAAVVRRNKDEITSLLADLQEMTGTVDSLVGVTRGDVAATLAELGPVLETLQAAKGQGKRMLIEASDLAVKIDRAVPTEYLNLLLVMNLSGNLGMTTPITDVVEGDR